MTVYKYELLQMRSLTVLWTLILAVLIILMLPVYVDMITTNQEAFSSMTSVDFYEYLGTSVEILREPIGVYSFLSSFILFACAVNGVNLGIGIFTKEYRFRTADFLLTKPLFRGKVFIAKILAVMTVGTIIGVGYTLASVVAISISTEAPVDLTALMLMGMSAVFVFLIYSMIGVLIGVMWPELQSKLMTAFGIVFVTYVFGSFSHKTKIAAVGLLSPIDYFNGSGIIADGRYDSVGFVMFLVLTTGLAVGSHYLFKHKDVKVSA